MTQLNKITLQHLRKFGDNVEIPVESGATIFLAPNGTGKTSIFEAVELALTGNVHRLFNKSLNTLIRDTFESASVRLDFDKDIFCQTKITKGLDPAITGNYKNLFGGIQAENVPFLLRLTHLLDQQSNGWFVHSCGTDAGSLLDNLSIGREAIKANGLMSGAKRAATALKDEAERARNDHAEKLAQWKTLIANRTQANIIKDKPLKPLADILKDLNTISVDAGVAGASSAELSLLVSYLTQVSGRNDINIQNLADKKAMLQNLEIVVGGYPKFVVELSALRKDIETSEGQLINLENYFDGLQKGLLDELTRLTNVQQELDVLEAAKKQADQLDKAKAEKTRLQQTIDTKSREIEVQTKLVQQTKENYEEAKRLANLNDSIQARRESLANNRAIQAYKATLLLQWRTNLRRISDLMQKKSELEALQRIKSDELKTAEEHHKDKIRLQDDALARFNNLNSASDSIKQAVGIIASNFPENRSECPVCLQQYDPAELRLRISQAVSAIDPELQSANKNLELAKLASDFSLIQMKNATDTRLEILNQLKLVNDEIEHINTVISGDLRPEFSGAATPEDAEKLHKEEDEKLEEVSANIEREYLNVTALISEDQLISLDNLLNQQEYKERLLNGELSDLSTRLAQASDTEQTLNPLITEKSENIQSKIIHHGIKLEELRISVDAFRNKKVEQETKIVDAKSQLGILNEKRTTLERDIKAGEHLWSNEKLAGNPDRQVLLDAQVTLQEALDKSVTVKTHLEDLQVELARWKAHEEFFQIDTEIKQLAGKLSEFDFEKELSLNLNKANKYLEQLLEKIGTLNTFSTKLSTEIDTIHEKIQSINPYWNLLLKRIVVDPRFSNINLNSYTYYKKQYADVNVPLHGQQVLASDIASEAQITDLQLTFLLAMAYKYQWSPWKGLLLDDPTQHHDLVHASGVFDLLRDYIVDHGFQILLATHDTVQAKFFMRKLENDGIPVKLWNLESSESGVVAKLY